MDVLVEVGFKVHRRFEAERAVEAHSIVKDFDPLEDGCARPGARGEGAAMDEFSFQSAPEAFHHGVVVTVAPSAHAGNDAGLGEPLPVGGTGVLDAPVGVMHQSSRRPSLGQGHVQRGQRQRGGQRVIHRPADTAACAAVQHAGQI